MTYAVIAENDESQWNDSTGATYHFPRRYAAMLKPGTRVVYYKGKLRNQAFAAKRLSADPHYFGIAEIGKVFPDPSSDKGDLFATIDNYRPFKAAVDFKLKGAHIEVVPPSRVTNYWRDGVRQIDAVTYDTIVNLSSLDDLAQVTVAQEPSDRFEDNDLESALEGSKTLRFVTTYERDPRYRKQAIAIHGLRCKACDEHMGEKYGPYAEGLIHVHHTTPVSTFEAPKKIDPALDLVPVCPNCHAVIHRKKTATLTIADLRKMLGKDIN